MEKVVFLDRDGVINKKPQEHDYVKSWDEFEFLPDTIDALKILTERKYSIFIVTNQRGIARKLITQSTLDKIHSLMQLELMKHSIIITDIYICPHNYSDNCLCRKPKPGLLLQAAKEYGINLSESVCIGDSDSDVEAGKNAGCKTYKISESLSLLRITNLL